MKKKDIAATKEKQKKTIMISTMLHTDLKVIAAKTKKTMENIAYHALKKEIEKHRPHL